MFGDNPVRKQDLDPAGALWVTDVFTTIQGEGPLAGTPAIFVRLSGCNLRCEFCDTDFETVREHNTVDELATRVTAAQHEAGGKVALVVITGGEPFIQNIVPLINRLYAWGFQVQVETAGTVYVQDFPWNKASVVISPKTGKVQHQFHLMVKDWKYVVSQSNSDLADGLPLNVARPTSKYAQVWIQPMDEHDEHDNKINRDLCVELAIEHGHRISLQTHKILEVE